MHKVCPITGKKRQYGNNVSHAKNATRRRFDSNIHTVQVYSGLLKEIVSIKVAAAGLRTIHRHGFDNVITKCSGLSRSLNKIKKRVLVEMEQKDILGNR